MTQKRPGRGPSDAHMTAEACRRIRTETLKLTQEQFAERLGVQPLAVIEWEQGRTPISKGRALAIQAVVQRDGVAS